MINKLLKNYVFKEQELKTRVLKLNESLTSLNEEDLILEEVMNKLNIEGAFIVIEDNKGRYLKKAVGIFLEIPSRQVELENIFQADQKINLEAKILSDDLPAEIYIPFVFNDFVCGIFLGPRCSHIEFVQDELSFITLILSQLAQRLIASIIFKEMSKEIKNLIQKSIDTQRRNIGLQGITTSLFTSIEKERKFIASEIHDGPLQLGLDLNRWLKYLIEKPAIVKIVVALTQNYFIKMGLLNRFNEIRTDARRWPEGTFVICDQKVPSVLQLICSIVSLGYQRAYPRPSVSGIPRGTLTLNSLHDH